MIRLFRPWLWIQTAFTRRCSFTVSIIQLHFLAVLFPLLPLSYSMNKVLQLGLQSSVINVAKFLVVPHRSLRVGSSIVGVGVRTTIFNKRLMSNATAKSIPFSINNSKGKELKIIADATELNSHQMVDAKGSDSDRDEMGTIQDNQKEVEAMTVQELKATLRKLGLPLKGRKQDLTAIHRVKVVVQNKRKLLCQSVQKVLP